ISSIISSIRAIASLYDTADSSELMMTLWVGMDRGMDRLQTGLPQRRGSGQNPIARQRGPPHEAVRHRARYARGHHVPVRSRALTNARDRTRAQYYRQVKARV